jgi:Tfp pilus assembly protein PilN
MINLLPPLEKKKTLLESKRRLIIILWILLLFSIFCFILVLLSIKFYIQGQIDSQRIVFSTAEAEFEQSGAQSLHKEINSVNLKLDKLNDFYQNKVYITEILEKISITLPQGLHLNDLSSSAFKINGEYGFKISLSGFASNREVLFDFKENLEKDKSFKEVYFPPINWVKPDDIDFAVTFKVK